MGRFVAQPPGVSKTVLDSQGQPFAELDYRTAEHAEVVLKGGHRIRVTLAHFAAGHGSGPLRLAMKSDEVFLEKRVTTIDGIDLGEVVAVARAPDGTVEALVAVRADNGEALAVAPGMVREVATHIILEPSEEEVREAQGAASKHPAVAQALALARKGAPRHR